MKNYKIFFLGDNRGLFTREFRARTDEDALKKAILLVYDEEIVEELKEGSDGTFNDMCDYLASIMDDYLDMGELIALIDTTDKRVIFGDCDPILYR